MLLTRNERLYRKRLQDDKDREASIKHAPVNVLTGVFRNVYLSKSARFFAYCNVSGVVSGGVAGEARDEDEDASAITTTLCTVVIPLALVVWKPRGKLARMLLDAGKDRKPSKMDQLHAEGRAIYLDETTNPGEQRENSVVTVYPVKFRDRTLAFAVCNFTYVDDKGREFYLFVAGLPTGSIMDNRFGDVVNFFAQALEVELSDKTRYNHTDMFAFRRISDCMLGFTVPAKPPKTTLVTRALQQLGLTQQSISLGKWLEIVHEHMLSSTMAALDVVRELVARQGGCHMFVDVSIMFDHVFRVMSGEQLPRLVYKFPPSGGNVPKFVESKDFGNVSEGNVSVTLSGNSRIVPVLFPGLPPSKHESFGFVEATFHELPLTPQQQQEQEEEE
jgi:hypothetical protein